ncbi:MAG: hypothetical protein P1Q69_11015 [Candidatus Thorarchaeota archaeon]|nr:hypothetical protein [Candidatus Thorarchaeota archaeon]
MKREYRILTLSILLLSMFFFTGTASANPILATDGEYSGPYVDKIVYKVITQDDQQVLHLQTQY